MRNNWRRVLLGDILKLRSERTHSVPTLLSVTASRGVIRQSDSGRRDSSSADKALYWDVHPGDAVYNTMRMWQGVSGVATEGGIVSPAYTVCEPMENVTSGFLRWLLKDPRLVAKFLNRSQGLVSDTWNLKYSEFKKIEIHLPPLSEQHRITEVLDAVDMQIKTARYILQKRSMAHTGMLDQLFSTGVHADRKPTHTPVGEIPSNWETLPVSELCEVRSGSTPSRSEGELYFSSTGTPWVKTLDLNEGVVNSTQERVTDIAREVSNMRTFPPGTVLVAMYGGWGQIGRTAVLGCPATVNQAISALRVKPDAKVLPEFLLLALQHGRSRWRRVGASTRKDANITKSDVEEFLIPIPDPAEQEAITRIMADLSTLRYEGERVIAKLDLFKRSTMADLLSGTVRTTTPR
ncbi:restriction endonuclease subunit S [Streptomyces sp. NPDC090301]|uniref:restriction endonuclease subunit S n=1 Tax=Streptomyces sp. NPDC090301 TaxID=3154975 RepID=UPI00341FFE2F